ncbi:MAG: aminotransferase class V-fold PLP-dependent enzyme [Schumannella sp.]
MSRTLLGPLSNRGTTGRSESNAEDAVLAFRSAYADLLGADPRGVVYGRSATQLCYDFSRHLAKTWVPGDEVVVSRLDHDANVRPWVQAAERAGATLRWLEIDPATADIDPASVDAAITDRTRLVAVTAASNLLGTMPHVRAIADRAHEVGALVYVDGVHYTAHEFVDVAELGADLFMCSPYKFLPGRTAPCWSPLPSCWRASTRTSSRPRPTWCRTLRVRHATLRDPYGGRDRRGECAGRHRPGRCVGQARRLRSSLRAPSTSTSCGCAGSSRRAWPNCPASPCGHGRSGAPRPCSSRSRAAT